MTCMEGASGNVMMSGHFAVSQPHNLYIGTAIQNQNKMNLGCYLQAGKIAGSGEGDRTQKIPRRIDAF